MDLTFDVNRLAIFKIVTNKINLMRFFMRETNFFLIIFWLRCNFLFIIQCGHSFNEAETRFVLIENNTSEKSSCMQILIPTNYNESYKTQTSKKTTQISNNLKEICVSPSIKLQIQTGYQINPHNFVCTGIIVSICKTYK